MISTQRPQLKRAFGSLPARVDSRMTRRSLYRWLLQHDLDFKPDKDATTYVNVDGSAVFAAPLALKLNQLLHQACALDADAYIEGALMLRRWVELPSERIERIQQRRLKIDGASHS